MIKYSTPNDPLRLFREEETEEGSVFARPGSDVPEGLAILKDMLDKLRAEPREDSVRKILEYSRLPDLH